MENLKITVFQGYLFWENIDKNLQNISLRLSGIREKTDLIILPEMFNTGFTMNAEKLAEPMNGKTMIWMHKVAKEFECVVTGSLIIKDGENYYNRLVRMANINIMIKGIYLPWQKKIKPILLEQVN